MLRRLLLLLLVLLPVGASPATQPVILVLGDSISAGHGIDVRRGWVALLQERLERRHLDYKVINSSISGDTTSSARARLPAALARYRPTIVIVELGGNDGLRGLPLTEMRNNIAAMILASRRHGARVLLLGVRLPPNYGSAYISAFGRVYHTLAERYRVALVPHLLQGVAGHADRMQSDGIHPRQNAQPRLLDNVWAKVAPMLQPRADAGRRTGAKM
jgi:acyl-CoA thioesterase-1